MTTETTTAYFFLRDDGKIVVSSEFGGAEESQIKADKTRVLKQGESFFNLTYKELDRVAQKTGGGLLEIEGKTARIIPKNGLNLG